MPRRPAAVPKPSASADALPSTKTSRTSKSAKKSVREQLQELPSDVLADLIERHAKSVPALKQEMMRLIGSDKAVITEIKRGIKKLSAVRPNTRSRPKEICEQLVNVLELIKHVGLRKPNEALQLISLLLSDASNVAGSFSNASVVATFFRTTLPAAAANVVARCTDTIAVRDELLILCVSDRYGTKAALLEGIGDALPDDTVNELRSRLMGRFKPTKYEWMNTNVDTIRLIKALDIAVGNIEGYEKAARLEGSISLDDMLVLARMCIGHELYNDANAWLDKVTNDHDWPHLRPLCTQRDRLYVQIAQASGSVTHAMNVFNKRLKNAPHHDLVQHISDLVGADNAATILRDTAATIVTQKHLHPRVVTFFVNNGFAEMMEQRMHTSLHTVREELEHFNPLAEAFYLKGRPIGAILSYRWLITSVLETASVAHYDYARYAFRLQQDICAQLRTMHGLETSAAFEERLRTTYASKKSFWDVLNNRRRNGYV